MLRNNWKCRAGRIRSCFRLALMFGACASEVFTAARVQADSGAEWLQRIPVRDGFCTGSVSGARPYGVSIVRVGIDDYLICNYIEIRRVRKVSGQWDVEALPRPSPDIFWCPTGLFRPHGRNQLYIANYKGGDVLRASFQLQTGRLTVEQRFTHPDMRGPENVAVSGDRVYAADYDGGAVFCFGLDGSFLWKSDCPQAHGLLVTQKGVYATSLQKRSVIKMDGQGHVVAEQGGLGWALGEYIWPVSLAETPQAGIVVLDAQAGRVTELTADLKPLRAIGSNGPGVDHFNYPYAILAEEGGYAIADTMKSRVVFFTDAWEMRGQVCSAGRQISLQGAPGISGLPSAPYTYPAFPGVDILGLLGIQECNTAASTFVGGFNSIDALGPAQQVTKELEIDDPRQVRIPGSTYWYMLWAMRVSSGEDAEVILIGSPQVSSCLALDPSTGAFVELNFPGDAWPADGAVLLSDGSRFDLRKAAGEANAEFCSIRKLLESGMSRAEAYSRIVAPELSPREHFEVFWKSLLTGSDGRTRVLDALVHGKDLSGPAEAAYLEARCAARVLLREILAVRYLSGKRMQSRMAVSGIEVRSPQRFYPGHGLEAALNNELPEAYAAQLEGQGSHQVSIQLDPPREVTALVLSWHASSIPTSFDVTFCSPDGTCVAERRIEGNNSLEHVIAAKPGVNVAEIQVAVRSFTGQQRLLIRRISIFEHGGGGLARSEVGELQIRAPAADIAPSAKVVESVPVYPGYGLENALDGDADDDYVAAVEGPMPQSFTLALGGEFAVRRVEIVWESDANYGIDYRIEACDEAGKLLGCLAREREREGRVQVVEIRESRKYAYLRFVVEKTAGQERLLLRLLRIFATR